LLNNVHDFFDAKYDQQQSAAGLAGTSERAGGKSSLMSVDSAREQQLAGMNGGGMSMMDAY